MNEIKSIPLPKHELLEHLSEKQIENLSNEYFNTSISEKELCAKYNIDLNQYSNFVDLFFVRENRDNSCSIHNTYSHQKNESWANERHWLLPYCPICEEPLYNYIPHKITPEQLLPGELAKNNIITKSLYLQLPLNVKVYIATCFKFTHNNSNRKKSISLLPTTEFKLCPDIKMVDHLIKTLQDYEKYENHSLGDVILDDELLSDFRQNRFLLDDNVSEYVNLWKEILYYEIMEYYTDQLTESNFRINFDQKTINALHALSESVSIQEAFYIIWRAVRSGERAYAKSGGNIFAALNAILKAMLELKNRLLNNEIKPIEFSRPSKIRQSEISKFFSNYITDLGIKSFTERPNEKHFIKIKTMDVFILDDLFDFEFDDDMNNLDEVDT